MGYKTGDFEFLSFIKLALGLWVLCRPRARRRAAMRIGLLDAWVGVRRFERRPLLCHVAHMQDNMGVYKNRETSQRPPGMVGRLRY